MVFLLVLFLVIAGLFFISLGLLFINYNSSPLKIIVKKEDVFLSPKLAFQIILPGIVLIAVSVIVFRSY